MLFLSVDDAERRTNISWWIVALFLGIVLFGSAGESSATRLVDPKLDFRPEDQVDKYPDLAINHKLYNVRVIVDAARSKQPRHMDAEVFSDLDSGSGGSGKNKKTVGIQTNITIEVSDEAEEAGRSNSKDSEDEDIENASVPVFKGKPVDKDKNRPESKLYYDYSGSKETPFPKTDDDSFRNLNWFYFQPQSQGYWTTAKPRTEDNFIHYGIGYRPSPTPAPYPDYLRVKPCFCKFHDDPPNRNQPKFDGPIPYHRSEEVYYSRGRSDMGSGSAGVDDKLEFPFHA